MHTKLGTLVLAALALAVVMVVMPAQGGDLAPPPGPIVSTDRSILSQATTPGPFTILASGSYKLTSDLTGGPTVLTVVADDVTIDLNGFSVDGGGAPGPVIQVSGRNVKIRNGTVRNTGSEGINSGAEGTVVEEVSVHDCGRGIVLSFGGRVSECNLRDIQNDGIMVVISATVTDCTVVRAGVGGFGWGITARDGSTVTGCAVRDSPDGIEVLAASTADRCAVTSNFSVGISADIGSTVRGCTARFNNTGFLVSGSSVMDCTAHTSFGVSYDCTFDASVDRCTSVESIGSGYRIGDRCAITNCRSLRDVQGGVGAGFETIGQNSVLSRNHALQSANDNYLINGFNNSVYANTAAAAGSGTNYNVAPANDVAPQVPASLSASGNENVSN